MLISLVRLHKHGNPTVLTVGGRQVKEQMYRACIGAMIGSEISFVIHDSPNAINPELKLIVGVRVRRM